MLSGMCAPLTPLPKGVRSVYVLYPVMMRRHSKGWRNGGTKERRVYGAVEEWLPREELRDGSRTGILFCQLECANGNVRVAEKLMNLMGEMPPLSANAWSIAIVSSGPWCFSLLFFDCFLHLAWLFVEQSLMWTLSQGNKGIDLRRESILSSVTYKSGLWKVISD